MLDTLLIIEDETLLGNELARHYRRRGWEVSLASSLTEARALIFRQTLDPLVVLSDMSLPDGNALGLLEEVRAHRQAGAWLLLTGYGSVADCVRALRLGAYNFVEKPCEMDRLDMLVEGAARSARAERRINEAFAQESKNYRIEAYRGESAAARRVRNVLAQLAEVPVNALLIVGEAGSGKGLVARIVHYSAVRAPGPWLECNCAALPRERLELELFGQEVDVGTGTGGLRRGMLERAEHGTLFLNHIDVLELPLQGRLLKVMEQGSLMRSGGEREVEVDVRIVASTRHDLAGRVRDGSFRGDLLHRLSVFNLHLPPLRERKEDLHQLVPFFIDEFNAAMGKNVCQLSDAAWDKLRAYDWPGNVRELRNAIERCVLQAEGETFPVRWLPLPRSDGNGQGAALAKLRQEGIFLPLDGTLTLADMERYILQHVLERTQYNVAAASRLLGTTRETLRYRVQKFNLKLSESA